MKRKYVFIGDTESANIEIINKSHKFIKNDLEYILIGNIKDLSNYLKKIPYNLDINEVFNPIDFDNYKKNHLNIFNVENISKEKSKNLLNQINIANYLSNISKLDLVTMPINKSLIKKKNAFIGMTEHLGSINKVKTTMIMHGEKFSVIPLTTHISLKDVHLYLNYMQLKKSLTNILIQINRELYGFKFNKIKFLCYNPHCSENNTLGNEDNLLKKVLSNFKIISGPFAADSAFKDIKLKTLFFSMYHDQALIPFKILNRKGINITLGLNYRRISPAHGTANDIKFKNVADETSYLACMEI